MTGRKAAVWEQSGGAERDRWAVGRGGARQVQAKQRRAMLT